MQEVLPEKKSIKNVDFNCDLAQAYGKYKNNVEFEPTLLSSEPIAVSKDEAVDALVALGYSSAEAKEAVDKCKKDGLNTEDIIKKSLTYIMSKSLR